MSKKYILLRPGIDPIETYAENPPRSGGCSVWLLLVGAAVLFIGRGVFAQPTPSTPIPTAAAIPSPTITATFPPATITPSATPSATPTVTASPSPTATASPTITPTPTATLIPWIDGQVSGTNWLNVRYGPGTAWPPLARLRRDDPVTIVGRDQGARWGQLDTGGWVSLAYITLPESAARLPVITPPPPAS